MQLLPTFEIQHFEEVVPSIKDIFISIVGETGDTDLK
jgi:hypothetical protein